MYSKLDPLSGRRWYRLPNKLFKDILVGEEFISGGSTFKKMTSKTAVLVTRPDKRYYFCFNERVFIPEK